MIKAKVAIAISNLDNFFAPPHFCAPGTCPLAQAAGPATSSCHWPARPFPPPQAPARPFPPVCCRPFLPLPLPLASSRASGWPFAVPLPRPHLPVTARCVKTCCRRSSPVSEWGLGKSSGLTLTTYDLLDLLATTYCLLPTAYYLLPTPYHLLLPATAYCLRPTTYHLLRATYDLLQLRLR